MKKLRRFGKKLISCCPIPARILFILAVVALILQAGFLLNPAFADYYNRYPGAYFRGFLAVITGWFPFSLAETLLMMLPLFVVLIIIHIFRVSKRTLREMVRLSLSLLAALTFFFSSFTFGFAAGYRTYPLDQKLGLERKTVSGEELDETADYLLTELKNVIPEITFRYGGFSIMPYPVSEMNRHLMTAYRNAAEQYDFLPVFYSRVKQVVLSEPMTYTHISGVYTYFTGESNLNVNFPDYTLPYTAAHELAHQRGIAREDEANFVAFLVCTESEDPYIRYSGYMSLYEYVISALYKADRDLYNARMSKTNLALRYEMSAYNAFFKKYEKSVAATVSNTINNSYLQSQGQKAGSRSYGMVVDLAVAYVKAQNAGG